MTQKILGPEGSKRRKRFWLVPISIAALAVVFYVSGAGAVLSNSPSSFEANDGNMTIGGNTPATLNGLSDWNCFRGGHGFATGSPPSCSSVSTSGALAKSDPAAT